MSNVVVGCEIEVLYNPESDGATFASLLGPAVQTIVRGQPSISELVNKARKASNITGHDTQKRQVASISEFNTWPNVVQDLDFEHLREASGNEVYFQSTTAASSAAKRKREDTVEDSFTDVEIDDTQLDEEDLKQLDCIESPKKISPQKLPNGNLKCNHTCKDKTKYHPVCNNFNIYRCRHLCCKDGKIDKKAKAKVCTSTTKKTRRSSLLQTISRDEGETGVPKESNLPRSSSVGIHLRLSPLEEVNPAETLEAHIIENPSSIAGPSLVKGSKLLLEFINIQDDFYPSNRLFSAVKKTR